MFYLVLISFLSLIAFLIVVNLPDNKFNVSGKIKKLSIEILWCYLGGLLFAVLNKLYEIDQGDATFDVGGDLLSYRNWDGSYSDVFNEFIFGFIITAIIIWSVKLYKKIK